jgi:hypothetical protein
VKKQLASSKPELIWLGCFLVLALSAPTVFAKALLFALCALLVWLYL